MKTCSHCKGEKSLEEFHRDKSKSDGLTSSCKKCMKATGVRYRERQLLRTDRVLTLNKHCGRCNSWKPTESFYVNLEHPTGRSVWCKQCSCAYHRFRKRGITQQIFESMLESQGNACAICKAPDPGGAGTWHIDHCHRTNEVRGLLCCFCNPLLGYARDNVTTLQSAIAYLKR